MPAKPHHFFALSCLIGLMSSCEQDQLEEASTGPVTSAQGMQAETDIVFLETFENSVPFYGAHGTDFSAPHSFSVVTAPAFQGSGAARFELRDTDPMISSGTRAEVTIVKDSVDKEMWYSFAAYFPADGFEIDSEKELISQWHQAADKHLGEKSQSPATQLVIKNDRFILDTGYNGELVSRGVDPASRVKIDLGPVTKDVWHEFVFHFVHSYQADGLIEIWHNGHQLLRHMGGNMYNSTAMPKWKLGIYKWKWNGEDTTDTRRRVLYYDNIKVGRARVSLAEMHPGTSLPPPVDPRPAPVSALTFINSHTDQDVGPLAAGDTLRFSALGTQKINIRAQADTAKTAAVKFVLKGAKEYTFVDKYEPYALFGDNGQGNYYYGTYLPAGNYTLEVVPYADAKARDIPGAPYTVNFTITD